MAPTRYRLKPASVAKTKPHPLPSSSEAKNSASPDSSGASTFTQPESLELPLRTMTETVAKNKHTNFTDACEENVPERYISSISESVRAERSPTADQNG